MSTRRGRRDQQKLKYNPLAILPDFLYLLFCLRVRWLVVHILVYISLIRLLFLQLLAGSEGGVGSEKNAFGT